jgi:putative transposase
VQLRYNFRIDPTLGQANRLARAFGCARVVFNDGLRVRKEARAAGLPYPKTADLSKALITEAKLTPERAWLGEVSAVVLQQSLRDLDTAYKNLFESKNGTRKGAKIAEPRFKSRKDTRQAVRFTANSRFKVTSGRKLSLPKIGEVSVRWSRDLPSEPSSVTVVKDAAGRFYASFVVETDPADDAGRFPLDPGRDYAETGIDLGLTHFAVFSDGRKVAAPKFLRREERKLAKHQKNLARKQKGSNHRRKAVAKVAKAHARVRDQRRDFQHKLSTTIVRDNQAVYVEDLCVNGLARTRLAKSVHDAGWSGFVSMFEYKCARYGRYFGRIGRFEPSSQTCTTCWAIEGPKPLNVREWTCSRCGIVHDRDVNAAKYVLAAGQADRVSACGAQVRPGLVPAQRRETGTRRSDPKREARAEDAVGISVL